MTVTTPPTEVDAVIIGAGFGGLYALYELRRRGFRTATFEAGKSVGGTWFWNRYPGARCDVESLAYQYSFSEDLVSEWTWSERYATQPEILAYVEWVADRLDLRKDITFETKVTAAEFDDDTSRWSVTTSDGRRWSARFLIAATGALSATSVPPFAGVDDYQGQVLHPGNWPAGGVDLTGKRVAVIGVGSSSVQLIPEVAKQAAQLTVFQRTPAYTIPARNRPLYQDEIASARRNHSALAQSARWTYAGINLPITGDRILETDPHKRQVMLEKNWKLGGNLFLTAFIDTGSDLDANEIMAVFVRDKIADVVTDPDTARRLTPTDYPIGAKRIITDTDYYATFNLPHVRLVSVLETPITRITPSGIETPEEAFEFDTIIYATGYDSMTGALTRIDIRGADGLTLKEAWKDGAHTYLGLGVSGFPNLFTVTGPQSPSVLANVIASIEQHVEWISDCMTHMRDEGAERIEAEPKAEDWWAGQVEEAVQGTLYLHAKSWYRGTNIEGKPSTFLVYCGGLDRYRRICDEVAAEGYRGFRIDKASAGNPANPMRAQAVTGARSE
ncbi:NAD(P)/FAD-dependent oxidoreductase [Sagittula sp. NFXS13]|uniref:flavin-containing monooxygenase n=1 Tax=Sagittula sp. NFXS13 TaxID=2819095 RepID=UPI0032DEF539